MIQGIQKWPWKFYGCEVEWGLSCVYSTIPGTWNSGCSISQSLVKKAIKNGCSFLQGTHKQLPARRRAASPFLLGYRKSVKALHTLYGGLHSIHMLWDHTRYEHAQGMSVQWSLGRNTLSSDVALACIPTVGLLFLKVAYMSYVCRAVSSGASKCFQWLWLCEAP